MSDNGVTIIAAVVTVVGTIAGVVIANRLTLSRSYKENIWDLRRIAYSLIVSELAEIERIYDNADVHISERGFPEYFEHGYSRDRKEVAKHMERVRDIFSADYLIFSKSFIELFNEFADKMYGDPYDTLSPDDAYEISTTAIRKFRPALAGRARREITSHKK